MCVRGVCGGGWLVGGGGAYYYYYHHYNYDCDYDDDDSYTTLAVTSSSLLSSFSAHKMLKYRLQLVFQGGRVSLVSHRHAAAAGRYAFRSWL